MSESRRPPMTVNLSPLDGPTAAWLLELRGQLQVALWQENGEEVKVLSTATEPDRLLYEPLQPASRKRR